MTHGHAVSTTTVQADVRETLMERGLATEHTQGLLQPTPRAQGYTHDPSSFEA